MCSVYVDTSLEFLWINTRKHDCWTLCQGMFSFVRLCLIFFQTGFNILQVMRVPFASFPHQHLCCQYSRFSSVLFSCSVVSDSLWPNGLQNTRPPCPSPTPGVYINSCPVSRWCHLIISSSVVPFSSCLQSFPTSGSFPMSQLFALGGQLGLEFQL